MDTECQSTYDQSPHKYVATSAQEQPFPIQVTLPDFVRLLQERLLARERSRISSCRSQTIPGEAITNLHLYNIASLMLMYQWTIDKRESLTRPHRAHETVMRTLEAGQKRITEQKKYESQYFNTVCSVWRFVN